MSTYHGLTSVYNSVLNVKALVGAFNQEKALVGAFSVIVKLQTLFPARVVSHLKKSMSPSMLPDRTMPSATTAWKSTAGAGVIFLMWTKESTSTR